MALLFKSLTLDRTQFAKYIHHRKESEENLHQEMRKKTIISLIAILDETMPFVMENPKMAILFVARWLVGSRSRCRP